MTPFWKNRWWKTTPIYTLCSQFMRFRIMRFSIYAVLGNGPNSCFMLQYSHIMRFLVKIIVYKILLIFFLHLCDSCIMRFLLGNKKRINGKLSVLVQKCTPFFSFLTDIKCLNRPIVLWWWPAKLVVYVCWPITGSMSCLTWLWSAIWLAATEIQITS